MIKRVCAILISISGLTQLANAQLRETQGWFFLTHTQKLSSKFDLLADVQLRSADKFDYLTTLLLRGGLSYNFDKHHSAALGYVYKGDWEHEDNGVVSYTLENRLFEQYLFKFKLKRTELTTRARLEQRWIKEEQADFSQRARAFLSVQVPLIADNGFTRGVYVTLQNELFVNVQHKERVNNSFFDQNRAFTAIGYRWNRKIDSEVGYMYWFQKEQDADYRRNVIQLMITTNF